jgi:phosphoribosylamine--glycine ligase
MGAYAPAPICSPQLLAQMGETVFQPTLAGLRREGAPYIGVLYAGLILTEQGPKVLEFNCRFGDPEAQVILPLLETDLLTIIEHSLSGTLSTLEIAWERAWAATVVLASGGYPGHYETGKAILGVAEAAKLAGVTIFHAGTHISDGQLVTAGGRVLNVTGTGSTLAEALGRAYQGIEFIQFEGKHYRTDIGARASHEQLL